MFSGVLSSASFKFYLIYEIVGKFEDVEILC